MTGTTRGLNELACAKKNSKRGERSPSQTREKEASEGAKTPAEATLKQEAGGEKEERA